MLFILTLLGCSEPGTGGSAMDSGEAQIIIDHVGYSAEAILDTMTLGETVYQKISLVVSDTFYIDILNENFEEEVMTWTGESLGAGGTMLFLISRDLGMYNPHKGFLIISGVTDSTITGRFKFDMYDMASSCVMYPGAEAGMECEGEFFAVVSS